MFCPKCGTQNPEDGKYCRSCGTDIGNVNAAMSKVPSSSSMFDEMDWGMESGGGKRRSSRRKDPNDVYADSIRSVLSGLGFFIVSMALLFTGVAAGQAWWWALLFPAFTFIAKGVADHMKYRKMIQTNQPQFSTYQQPGIGGSPVTTALPPQQTQFVAPESRYKTGDLVPPSVTDSTTKLLEIDQDGETKTLPNT